MLDTELFTKSMDMALIAICAGISVGVALTATIFWAKTYGQLVFRFFRTVILSAVVIGIPFWYSHAATFINTMISGITG